MEKLTIKPIQQISGDIFLPGSKSISNRALLVAALAEGTTTLTNLLSSDDTNMMLAALKDLGIEYSLSSQETECVVIGSKGQFKWKNDQALYLGNAGTAMRSLAAVLNLKQSHNQPSDRIILTGDERMQERPIEHLIDALLQIGCKITYLKKPGYPPIALYNQGIKGGQISIDGSLSSQYISALLILLPLIENDSQINIVGELVSKPYIDITINMLAKFGVEIINEDYKIFYIKGNQQYKAIPNYTIEGDASSASYFLAAGAIKGKVKVIGIDKNSIQGDKLFAKVLEQMGAKITWGKGYIQAEKSELRGINIDLNHIPDAAMTIAVVALFAKGQTTITNIYNWRIKETDRLTAMSNELRKVGAVVEEGHDYISITPPQNFKHAEIATYNDHRMAMCFSLVALSNVAVTILDPKCTSKTFPSFFKQYANLCM